MLEAPGQNIFDTLLSKNQRSEIQKVIIDYARQNGVELINIFEDNNVSGYTVERDGLNRLKELMEDGQVDALVAKALSRIGRHNAKVLLFLDYLDDYFEDRIR